MSPEARLIVIMAAMLLGVALAGVVQAWRDRRTDKLITKGLAYGDRRGWWDRYFR